MNLCDDWVGHLLGQWSASSPWATRAFGIAQDGHTRVMETQAVKEYAACLLPAKEMIYLLLELRAPKKGFEVFSAVFTQCVEKTGRPFPHPICTFDEFDKEWAKLLEPYKVLGPKYTDDPPITGIQWDFPSWVAYIRSRPCFADTIDWTIPITIIVRGDGYPCGGGSWVQLGVSLMNHGLRSRSPAYYWPICSASGDNKDLPSLQIVWSKKIEVRPRFCMLVFFRI